MRVAGIDPGKTGACALYEVATGDLLAPPKPRVVDIIDLPISGDRLDSAGLKRWLLAHHPDVVCIEISRIRPKMEGGRPVFQNVATMGKLLEINGMAQGVVECLGIDLVRADPTVWKRRAGLLGKDKRAGLDLARSIAGPRATREWLRRQKDHNRGEALLLAVYAAELRVNAMRVAAHREASDEVGRASASAG